jgi:hypothetical protein
MKKIKKTLAILNIEELIVQNIIIKIKNETEFKEKISNYKRQYYINKKEQLLEIIV